MLKDYGAIGDGVNDDRQAIQDTIDAAAKGLGGGNVYFPEGTYLVKEIVFKKSYTLRIEWESYNSKWYKY